MSQMDKYMQQAIKIYKEVNRILNEAASYVRNDKIEETKIKTDEAIEKQKEIISLADKAYQYADGPYKEIIELFIQENHLRSQYLESLKEAAEYMKEGDYASVRKLEAREGILVEISKIDARIKTI